MYRNRNYVRFGVLFAHFGLLIFPTQIMTSLNRLKKGSGPIGKLNGGFNNYL